MSKDLVCVLEEMGEGCNGELKERNWLRQIKAPICDFHYKKHLVILSLYQNGVNIEDVLTMTGDEREFKLNEISSSINKSVDELLDEAYKYDQALV